MPRRREVPKREVPPDPIYNSSLVTKFVRTVMKGGKRSTAEGVIYRSLDIIKSKTGDDPIKVFKKAIARHGGSATAKSNGSATVHKARGPAIKSTAGRRKYAARSKR